MPEYPLFDISGDDNIVPRFTGLNRFDRLNHSDLEELLDNERVLPADTQRLLRTGMHKIEAYPERFARERDDYPSLLALVAASTWCRAREFCLCGLMNARRQSQPCHIWNLCPPCSYIQRKRSALDAYLTRFRRTSWRLVTISFQAEFGDGIYDGDEVGLCWQAVLSALHRSRREGIIRGAMTRTELHLESFLPMRYYPHLHAVVDAGSFDRETVAGFVFAHCCPDTGDRIAWPVSIHDRPLTNESSLANALSYLGKPLDLARPYQAAWPVAAESNRRRAPELNAEVNEFLDAFSSFVIEGHQVRYLGTLHHASRQSLRATREQRRHNRDVVSAILAEGSLENWNEDEGGPASIFQPQSADHRSDRIYGGLT